MSEIFADALVTEVYEVLGDDLLKQSETDVSEGPADDLSRHGVEIDFFAVPGADLLRLWVVTNSCWDDETTPLTTMS